MIGFWDKEKKLNYKIVEEAFHCPEDVIAVEVNTFNWENATVKK